MFKYNEGNHHYNKDNKRVLQKGLKKIINVKSLAKYN